MVGSNSNIKLRLSIRYLIAIVLLVIMVFPYLYMVLNSLADWSQVDRKLIPTQFTLRSYQWLFTGGETGITRPWIHAFFNSVFVSLVSTALMMMFAIMVAYALAKLKFRGRDSINNFVLFHMFFPAIILIIPNFLIIQKVGLFDTYWALIIPKAMSLWGSSCTPTSLRRYPTLS